MASPTLRISRSLSRSWSSAVAGISRSPAASSNVMQSRAYSDEGFKDPRSAVPDNLAADPSLSFDSPSGSSLSDGFPESGLKPHEQSGGYRNEYSRNAYPPRQFRIPRGVYKAIILGEVGQLPVQKILKSGKSVTIFSVGTGGMYNNRRPFEGESPQEFAERSYTQWHRISVYQDKIAALVMQHVRPGSQVYLEGNIESRVYNDPNSGVVKRIREIAIRNNGRLMFMDGMKTDATSAQSSLSVNARDEPLTVPQADP